MVNIVMMSWYIHAGNVCYHCCHILWDVLVWKQRYSLFNSLADKLLFLIYSGNAAGTKSDFSYSCDGDGVDRWLKLINISQCTLPTSQHDQSVYWSVNSETGCCQYSMNKNAFVDVACGQSICFHYHHLAHVPYSLHTLKIPFSPADRPCWSQPGRVTQQWTGWCRGSCGWYCGHSAAHGRSKRWRCR